jgi:hypothetical protein
MPQNHIVMVRGHDIRVPKASITRADIAGAIVALTSADQAGIARTKSGRAMTFA